MRKTLLPRHADTIHLSKIDFQRIFSVQRSPGDGNCFFHSLYSGIRVTKNQQNENVQRAVRSSNYVFALRSIAAEEIEKNAKEYEPFLSIPIREYCRRLRGGAWGDAIVAAALSKALQVAIYVAVVNPRNEMKYATLRLAKADPQVKDAIFLLFSGPFDSGHYDFLKRV